MPLTDRQILAAKAARDLVDMLPPQDFGNPKNVMAGIVTVLADYHQSVITAAPVAIAKRTNRLTLKAVKDVCDEMQDTVARKLECDRAAAQHQALRLEAPAKPTQEERDASVADYEQRIKPLIAGSLNTIAPARVERAPDGRHFDRIKADLEARRARNERDQQTPSPP